MISAEVIKGIQDLLVEQGAEQRTGERLSDFVARGLGASPQQTEILLESLHDGESIDGACLAAGIDRTTISDDLLVQLARVIGRTLGRAAR